MQRDALVAADQALTESRFAEGSPAEALRVRLQERIRRDLLPRLSLAGDAPVLLVAVAGPNNVGKSSLFNTLCGERLSPARAEAGLTKQCLAVANPSLVEGPVRGLLAERYEVERLARGARAPVDQPGPPGRLYLAESAQLPPGLLLMDTPDFDSVYAQNRANAEVLLLTVDLVVFVVSRQTYQNALLVSFLRDVVGAGRPYVLVYNEANSAETARRHLEKLAEDVGHPPVGRVYALHQPEVEDGAPVKTEPLEGPPLQSLLFDVASRARLKAQALQAGLDDCARELGQLAAAAVQAQQEPHRLLERLRHELLQAGQRAAQKSVPADVLITALRDELDARSPVHRFIRLPFRALSTALSAVGRAARRALQGSAPAAGGTPEALSEESLRDGLRRVLDALAPEAALARDDAELQGLLLAALGADVRQQLERKLTLPSLQRPEQDRAALLEFCRSLVREEMPGGAEEGAMQALATLVYSVPTSAAALVTVTTGGVGPDLVVWAGSLLTTPLMSRFVDLLGSHIRERVQKRWAEAHGLTLAQEAEDALFGALSQVLAARIASGQRTALALRTAQGRILEPAARDPAASEPGTKELTP